MGVTCLGSRVVGLNVTRLGAVGRLEILGQLTELTVLKLYNNSFQGMPRVTEGMVCCILPHRSVRRPHTCSGLAQPDQASLLES